MDEIFCCVEFKKYTKFLFLIHFHYNHTGIKIVLEKQEKRINQLEPHILLSVPVKNLGSNLK
jgi:hypothetical protein